MGQGSSVNCNDPSAAERPECRSGQAQQSTGTASANDATQSVHTPVLTAPADQYIPATPPLNPSQLPHPEGMNGPLTEFEQIVADSVGRPLPLFGQSLFVSPPSTFSPIDRMEVPSDYIIGPGDQLQIRIWGQVQADLRVTVDRAGQIYIPQVGEISVAGIKYGELEEDLKRAVSKVFKNFNLTANVGRLRSIQVIVVGNARYPGTYTISALSTLINAIFASGGPAPQGSLRHIQVRRNSSVITDFDFYDLLVKGDKSKDVRLQSGDVIYFPPVGPLVAISGSVNTPAIYEMKDSSTLQDLVETAGGMSTVADTGKITIDRIVEHQARQTLEFPYDEQSRGQPMKDGDIVRVLSIVPRFENTVTLRGNVANPGRYPWKPGMRVRDLIPNAQALLTRRYWQNRAAIVSGRATEYPASPASSTSSALAPSSPQSAAGNGTPGSATAGSNAGYNLQQVLPNDLTPAVAGSAVAQGQQPKQAAPNAQTPLGSSIAESQQQAQSLAENSYRRNVRDVADDVRRYAPQINWDYAIIQRVNPQDLSSKLLWMNPRKAILENDEASNLELEPGDIVTIFSQQDISVPQAERSQYVTVEGEVQRAGVYKLESNETLRMLLQRAGGLTPNAYVYGTQLTRESARVDQQRSLDELARSLEVQIRQSALSVAASTSGGDAAGILAAQESIIGQLRNTRASGRVALPVKPTDKTITAYPDMVLEDGDRVVIPHTPTTVSVTGSVYNPGSFIFQPRNSAGMYLEMAGRGKPQSDLKHAFVLRANGVVVAANNVNGIFTGDKFGKLRLFPGDQVVVPYKLPTGAFVRGLRDWSQIGSQLAITAAALAVVVP
jgi:protein involved in polysaccharide export with SLBB domain